MAVGDVFKTIKENEVKFVDLRFTDTKGKEQHVSVPVKAFSEDKFKDGHAFDGSSIAGWKGIEASDMLLMPDPDSARMDPFYDEPTLVLTCDVLEPSTGKGYDRARDQLSGKGLVPVVSSEEFSDTVPEGSVISQNPTSGTLYKGDKVEFVVSKGPELVEMPGVRGDSVASATAELEALGLVVDVQRDGTYLGLDLVLRTDPSSGTMLPGLPSSLLTHQVWKEPAREQSVCS